MSQQRIVVSGANGFIGRYLCSALVADGHQVVGITRNPNAKLPMCVTVAHAASLLDRRAVREALAGATSVVHLAARVHAKPQGLDDPGSECQRVNVDGTVALLEEGVAAGVKTFAFISSVKAVCGNSERMLTSQTKAEPVDAYGVTKLEAERRVRAIATLAGIGAPILRLPVVYGIGMKANMSKLFWAIHHGLPLPFGLVRNRRSLAYVGNVVAAIQALLKTPGAGQGTFYVSDGEDFSTPELVRKIAGAMGQRARLFPVPPVLFEAALGIGGLLSRIAPFHLTGDSLSAVLGSLFVDSTSLSEATGFDAPFSVDEGMHLTAEWYKEIAGERR